jgi:DNA-binding transcriptional LysR family regulator
MRDVSTMEVFVRTVLCGSLSAAGRELNLTPAAVSYRIARLEDSLGTRLLHRTTRRLRLTEDGTEYFRNAEQIVADIERAEAAISRRNDVPQGTLKLTAPASFGRQHIAPILPKFLRRFPDVHLNFVMTDEMIDLLGEGVDLAIRISELKDSGFIARKVAPDYRVVVAAPDYIERYGAPQTPADLAHHNCLMLSQQQFWMFNGPDGPERIRVAGNFQCNNGEVIREAALAGLGIALKATWDIAGAIKAGRLKVLLKNYPISSQTSIWALYPSRRNVPAKVTAFVDFLRENFVSQPYWDTIDCV